MLPETGKEKRCQRERHSEINVFSWVVHSDTACTSCDQYKHAHTLTTGRKQKGKSPFWGRPRASKAIAYIRAIAPSSHRPKNGTHEYLLPSSCASYFTLADLECNICTQILDGPVELPCGNTVCANCLCEKLDQKREMVCPCCPTEHLLDHTHITTFRCRGRYHYLHAVLPDPFQQCLGNADISHVRGTRSSFPQIMEDGTGVHGRARG